LVPPFVAPSAASGNAGALANTTNNPTAANNNNSANSNTNTGKSSAGNNASTASSSPVSVPMPIFSNSQAVPTVQSDLSARIESWKNAWSKADVTAYSEHYAKDYKGDLASHAAWLAQRKRVMQNAGDISIALSDINIIQTSATEARATFTQNYQSKRLKETGEKSLFFQRDERFGGEWKIVAERFAK
jgi:murein L,D-transpeptidase YafK